MHLSSMDCMRFYWLIDALSLYAKERLNIPDIPGDVYLCDRPLLSDQFRYEVNKVLWEHPDIIDEFISENPYDLDDMLLSEAATWKAARPRLYTLWKHESGRSIFMGAEGTFAVMGLSQDISEIIPDTPTIVETTLLPFYGSIVYSVTIVQYPIEMMDGALEMQRRIFEKERAKGIIRSAREFTRLSHEFNERKAQENLDRFWEDISRQNDIANGREKLPAGFHRGVLAGLSEEERERMVLAKVKEVSKAKSILLEILEKSAVRKKPVFSLYEQLMLETKASLLELARSYGVRGLTSLKKGELAERVSEIVLQKADAARSSLTYCNDGLFDSTLNAFKSQESIAFTAEDVLDDKVEAVFPFPPFTQLFLHDNTFTLVMSPEIRTMLEGRWDEIEPLRKRKRDIAHCAEVCTSVYGLTSIGDFARQLKEWYGHDIDLPQLVAEIIKTMEWGDTEYDLWLPGHGFYLIAIELSDEFGIFGSGENGGNYLDDYREHILDRHDEIDRKPLDPALREMDPFEWKQKLPSTLRLRNYLDAHVLDGIEDCFFAEDIIEDLIMHSAGPVDPSSTVHYLEQKGLLVDLDSANTLIGLVMGMLNGLPHWENNGWSPQELFERETGQKMFFNEDGRRMKVGRNDPCPCGSGKKYKKCCGR